MKAAACVCAVLAGCSPKPAAPTGPSGPAPVAFTLTGVTAERSAQHVHLTVAIHVQNSGPAELVLAPPAAQLWIAKDKPAAPFIAPGLDPAVIAPGAESAAATHWWLAASDLSGPLELEVAGVRQTVKSDGGFPIDSLPENRPLTLHPTQWKLEAP